MVVISVINYYKNNHFSHRMLFRRARIAPGARPRAGCARLAGRLRKAGFCATILERKNHVLRASRPHPVRKVGAVFANLARFSTSIPTRAGWTPRTLEFNEWSVIQATPPCFDALHAFVDTLSMFSGLLTSINEPVSIMISGVKQRLSIENARMAARKRSGSRAVGEVGFCGNLLARTYGLPVP